MKPSAGLLPVFALVVCALVGPPTRAQEESPPEPPPTETAPAAKPVTPPPTPETAPAESSGGESAAEEKHTEVDTGEEAGETETDDDKEADPGKATLKIECDLTCMVTVGLDAPEEVTAGETLTAKVDPGAIRIKAYLVDVIEARTFEDVTVAAGERKRVRLKMAKALADLRKKQARDGTFRDINTRLMWPTRDNGGDVEWQEAVDFCESSLHGGWDDWRLPTLAELEGIEAMWSLRAYKTADPITLSSCCSWSSDRVDEDNAWNFNYRFRRAFPGHVHYSLSLRALCVRDGSDEIPENTRKNRRLAKREAKERQRERLLRQEEKAAEKTAEEAAENDDDDSGGD